MAKKTKSARVKAEKKRLEKNYADLTPAKKAVAMGLIERAAFMLIEMEDLEEYLAKNDWVEKFQQGKDQEPYDRARPQGQTYNAINGNYQKIIKQLDVMLPKEEQKPKEENDGFDAFVSGGDEV